MSGPPACAGRYAAHEAGSAHHARRNPRCVARWRHGPQLLRLTPHGNAGQQPAPASVGTPATQHKCVCFSTTEAMGYGGLAQHTVQAYWEWQNAALEDITKCACSDQLLLTSTIMRAKLLRLRFEPSMPCTSTAVGTSLVVASVEKRTRLPCSSSYACIAPPA